MTTTIRELSHNERVAIEAASEARPHARGARGKHGQAKQSARERLTDPRGKQVKRIVAPVAALREFIDVTEDGREAYVEHKLGTDCEVRLVRLSHASHAGKRELEYHAGKLRCVIIPFGEIGNESVNLPRRAPIDTTRHNEFWLSGPVNALYDICTMTSKILVDGAQVPVIREWRYPVTSRTGGLATGEGKASPAAAKRIREGKQEQIARAQDRANAPVINAIGNVPGIGLVSAVQVRPVQLHPEAASLSAVLASIGYDISNFPADEQYSALDTLSAILRAGNAKQWETVVSLKVRLASRWGIILPVSDAEKTAINAIQTEREIKQVLRQWVDYAGEQGAQSAAARIIANAEQIAAERAQVEKQDAEDSMRECFYSGRTIGENWFYVPAYTEQPDMGDIGNNVERCFPATVRLIPAY